ncbi:hypothetical protein [Streptomyces chartreusis]
MTRMQQGATAVASLIVGMLTISACSSLTEPYNDAPIDHKVDSPAIVYSGPDGFANFMEKCDEFGNLVITTRTEGGEAAAVVPNEEGCAKFDKGAEAWKKAK